MNLFLIVKFFIHKHRAIEGKLAFDLQSEKNLYNDTNLYPTL
jgi:hypothetical protein